MTMCIACRRCRDLGWVCENHDTRPWSDDLLDGCTCGAGAPCPDCNTSHGPHDPPHVAGIMRPDVSRDDPASAS